MKWQHRTYSHFSKWIEFFVLLKKFNKKREKIKPKRDYIFVYRLFSRFQNAWVWETWQKWIWIRDEMRRKKVNAENGSVSFDI